MSGLIITGQQAAAGRATGDGTVAALHHALAVISSVCDYAQELDAQGFSAADAWLGHVLAQMAPGLWSDSVALAAWDMLRKYRGQLTAAGIDYDQLPRPADAGELEAGRREQAREHARDHARQWREQHYRQAHSYIRCDGEGEQVILAFPYDPDLVAACRKIDGRRYDGATKANVFPFTSLPAAVALAAGFGIEVTADLRALAAIAAERAAERAAEPQVRLDERDGTIIIDASLGASLYQEVKELNGTWDRAARVHRVAAHHAQVLANLAEQNGLRISDQVRELAAKTSARQEENRNAADAFEADPVPVPGLAAGLALKAQQYPVVRFALKHRRVLIGDDMGWGKTLSSLAAAAAAIFDLAKDLRLRQIDVLGVQYGAGVAMELAAARPELVRRLVLAGIPSADALPPATPQRLVIDLTDYGDHPFDTAAQPLAKQIGAFLRGRP